MIPAQPAIEVPLQADEYGTIRVAGTRVTLESVIADFQRGATPEEIVHNFPVLKVADVYHVIGYYLENRVEVERYIQSQHEANEQIRSEWEAQHPPKITKADLIARMDKNNQKR